MILCVENQPVVGKHDALRAALVSARCVNVAFRVGAPFRFGQCPLVVAEPIAADRFAGRIFQQGAALPAERLCFGLGDIILRQRAVFHQIERDRVPAGVASLLLEHGVAERKGFDPRNRGAERNVRQCAGAVADQCRGRAIRDRAVCAGVGLASAVGYDDLGRPVCAADDAGVLRAAGERREQEQQRQPQ